MDRIIYDKKAEQMISIWGMVAKNKKIAHLPFEELEMEFRNLGNEAKNLEGTLLIFKGNRIIMNLKDNKQVIKVELIDGEIKCTKITYSTFTEAQEEGMATFMRKSIELIMMFVANFNIDENDEARREVENFKNILKLQKFLEGGVHLSKKNIKQSNKGEYKYSPNNKVNLINIAKSYRYTQKGGNYTIHCESWRVKGHSRRLKNGSVIWVKPYVKGKGKVKDKIYKL